MVDRRRLIGNDMVAGGTKLKPYRHPPVQQRLREQSEVLRAHRQRAIAYTAKPPAPPLPQPIKKSVPDTPSFNQFAYSILLIAIMSAIAIATPLINWMFLVYGLLAIVARVPSRLIFVSALICLTIIAISSALSKESTANIFAIMTFYFILIGLLRAVLELRRQGSIAANRKS
jgi:hypothetical protein